MAGIPGIKTPEPLEVGHNMASSWKRFKDRLEIYIIAIGYEDKSAKEKTGLLLNMIGEEGYDLFKSFDFAGGEDKWDYPTVMAKFESTCNPRKDTFKPREELWHMRQKTDQTVDQFVAELRRKMADCAIDDEALRKSLLRQRLIAGLKDDGCRTRILDKGEDYSVEDAIKLARNSELTRKEIKELEDKEVAAVSSYKKKYSHQNYKSKPQYRPRAPEARPRAPEDRQDPQKPRQSECTSCGRRHGWRCPAYNKNCNKCGAKGHFAKKCHNKKKVHDIKVESDPTQTSSQRETPDDFFVDSVTSDEAQESWLVSFNINGVVIPLKLDTGADISIIRREDLHKMTPRPKLHRANCMAYAYGNSQIGLIGQCVVDVSVKGQKQKCLFYVADGVQSILSREMCKMGSCKESVDCN